MPVLGNVVRKPLPAVGILQAVDASIDAGVSLCTIFCPEETEETTTMRGFPGGRKSSKAAQKVRVAALIGGRFAVLEPVEAAGPLLGLGRSVMRNPTVSSPRPPTGVQPRR